MTFKHASAVEVWLWGSHVGTIVPFRGPYYRFVYDQSFLATGIKIAPFELPLEPGEFMFTDRPAGAFYGLPAVFADSLPDAFGNSVIDEWMLRKNVRPDSVTPLDRLAYVGSRAMGALEYEPDRGPRMRPQLSLNMRRVIEESRHALNGRIEMLDPEAQLREIFRVGTSAGGAQAKAVVAWNRETGRFMLPFGELPSGYEHWIVKITPEERPYTGEAEFRTYELARRCGVEMSESRLLELDGLRHFMTKRFDRGNGERHHLLTFRAMRTLPPDAATQMNSYEQLFATIDELGMGYEAMEQMFRRMVFNVLVDETDDHAKNFSFLLRKGGGWELAPAYDLTGGVPSAADADDARRQWTNFHAMTINGKNGNITTADLLAVADRFAIGSAKSILEEITDVIIHRR